MKIEEIVFSTLNEVLENNDLEVDDISVKTRLFGSDGILDSIGIVMLITELEEVLEDELSLEITLADDRAMSQKTSPFRNVGTLIQYIEKLAS
jgi:acyl carrier protein